ncbi:MAG: TetR/AcrR family transcriptional regulator [Clostridiales bacterium]|nr:TetR/AcrR family transcriptional regulator [Clostridiales bacterium]
MDTKNNKSTRDMIIEQAKHLFNDKGYSRVTMRDIAAASATSLGNLTHHFHSKADLISVIFQRSQEGLTRILEERLRQGDSYPYNLQKVYDVFLLAEQRAKDNAWYWRNLTEIVNGYPLIAEQEGRARSTVIEYYITAFRALKTDGVLRSDVTDEQYQALALTLVQLMNTWYQNGSLTSDAENCKFCYSENCIYLLYPYLTDKGRLEYKEIISGMGVQKND